MIAYLKGELVFKSDEYIILEVQKIGYKVFMSKTAIDKLEEGKEIKIFTYLRLREDDVSLFGFTTNEELHMFELLISVGGIGAKSAINILSNITPSAFALAVITNNVNTLKKLQGIGPKTAQRIILELKDKTLVGWSHAGNGELPKSSCKRKNTERYDYIVAINERMKKGYEKSTKRPQIVKLYNFMGLESIIEKSKIAIPEKFKYIVSVGSLTDNKNQGLLIDVFYELKKESGIEEKLILIGEGKERARLEEKVKNLGMENEIFLLGAKLNPYNYIKDAELYVVTSKEEGFSLTTLEAMTLKTMVIATKTDGTREILGEDSQYGKLVESSKEELKREILYYLKNREKRRVYEELGYTRAKDFSKDNAITKIEEFIDRL